MNYAKVDIFTQVEGFLSSLGVVGSTGLAFPLRSWLRVSSYRARKQLGAWIPIWIQRGCPFGGQILCPGHRVG